MMNDVKKIYLLTMVKKVVIVGAGPCGLLLAHYLLRRDDKYQIDMYERRGDPRQTSFSNARTFSIAISLRGKNALDKIDGLWETIKTKGVELLGSSVHQKNGKTRSFSSGKLKSIIIHRYFLTTTLL